MGQPIIADQLHHLGIDHHDAQIVSGRRVIRLYGEQADQGETEFELFGGATILTWTLDATPPSVVLAHEGDPESAATSQLRLAFELGDGSATCTSDGVAIPCDGGLVDALTPVGGQAATHTVEVITHDLAGNQGEPSRLTWTYAIATRVD